MFQFEHIDLKEAVDDMNLSNNNTLKGNFHLRQLFNEIKGKWTSNRQAVCFKTQIKQNYSISYKCMKTRYL